jgi:hypothetical protein
VSSCHVTLICHRQEQRTREGGAFIGRKKIYILCIIRWILFSMFSTAKSWLATKPRPIFSARQQNVFDVLLSFNRISSSVDVYFYFFSLYASFIPAGWLSLSLFSYIQLLHISTQTDNIVIFFFFCLLSYVFIRMSHIIVYYYGLLLMMSVSVPL